MDSLHFKTVDKSDIRGMERIPIFEEENTEIRISDSWHILIFLTAQYICTIEIVMGQLSWVVMINYCTDS